MKSKEYNVSNTDTKTGKQTSKGSSVKKTEFHPSAQPVQQKPTPQPSTYKNIQEGITAKKKRETNAGLRK